MTAFTRPDYAVISATGSAINPYCVTFMQLIGDGDNPTKRCCGRVYQQSAIGAYDACRLRGLNKSAIVAKFGGAR